MKKLKCLKLDCINDAEYLHNYCSLHRDESRRTMFPRYKGIWPFRKPDGWKDIGKVRGTILNNDPTLVEFVVHGICKNRLHVGKEFGRLFYFCPKCLVRISPDAVMTVLNRATEWPSISEP